MAKIKPSIVRKLRQYVNDIGDVCPIDRVVLFGSYAKGTQDKDSDIDIAVFSKDITDANRHRYMTLFLERVFRHKLDIQPVAFSLDEYNSHTDRFITDEIRKNGIVLYSRN